MEFLSKMVTQTDSSPRKIFGAVITYGLFDCPLARELDLMVKPWTEAKQKKRAVRAYNFILSRVYDQWDRHWRKKKMSEDVLLTYPSFIYGCLEPQPSTINNQLSTSFFPFLLTCGNRERNLRLAYSFFFIFFIACFFVFSSQHRKIPLSTDANVTRHE